jgi:hypothetical protein
MRVFLTSSGRGDDTVRRYVSKPYNCPSIAPHFNHIRSHRFWFLGRSRWTFGRWANSRNKSAARSQCRLKAALREDAANRYLRGLLLGLSFSLLRCGFSFLCLGLNLLGAQCRFEFMNRFTKRKIVVNHRFLQVGKWNVEVL